jgi:hypothetical protein
MSEGPSESEILIEFARAAAKAQEIERILSDTLVAYAVDKDTKDRSFEKIAEEIDGLSLGQLQKDISRHSGKTNTIKASKKCSAVSTTREFFLCTNSSSHFPWKN